MDGNYGIGSGVLAREMADVRRKTSKLVTVASA